MTFGALLEIEIYDSAGGLMLVKGNGEPIEAIDGKIQIRQVRELAGLSGPIARVATISYQTDRYGYRRGTRRRAMRSYTHQFPQTTAPVAIVDEQGDCKLSGGSYYVPTKNGQLGMIEEKRPWQQ